MKTSNCFIAILAALTLGCSSSPKGHGSSETVKDEAATLSRETALDKETLEDSGSKVLSAKKCPKKSKMVNGKCTMQVESAD